MDYILKMNVLQLLGLFTVTVQTNIVRLAGQVVRLVGLNTKIGQQPRQTPVVLLTAPRVQQEIIHLVMFREKFVIGKNVKIQISIVFKIHVEQM